VSLYQLVSLYQIRKTLNHEASVAGLSACTLVSLYQIRLEFGFVSRL